MLGPDRVSIGDALVGLVSPGLRYNRVYPGYKDNYPVS